MKTILWLLALISAGSCFASLWQAQIPPTDALIIANRISKQVPNLHRAELLLQYSVQGRFYREWQTDGAPNSKRSRIEALLGERSPGTHIQIFVDPSNPQKMVPASPRWKTYVGAILFGILSLAAAIAAQVVYLS
ncbi:MAG: hypothetical protein NTW74_20045 [Acidobacteria bacterium]|nr:hypothetical protein [Acidobacteriota bacterium]